MSKSDLLGYRREKHPQTRVTDVVFAERINSLRDLRTVYISEYYEEIQTSDVFRTLTRLENLETLTTWNVKAI